MEGIEYTIASPLKRVLAYIIDSMFMSIASIIILFVIGQGDGLSAIAEYSGGDVNQIVEKILPVVQILTGIQLFVGILYFGVFQALSNGASLGKKLLHIRIVCIDGSEFSVINGVLRYVVNAISMQLCFLLGLVMFFTTYKQALHDLVVKTTVVDE
ncbi:MAG: RDD family protein [bacterium]